MRPTEDAEEEAAAWGMTVEEYKNRAWAYFLELLAPGNYGKVFHPGTIELSARFEGYLVGIWLHWV